MINMIMARLNLRNQNVKEEVGLLKGRMLRHKGIHWRPRRKHHWVVEIKLRKKNKLWVGYFDSLEEVVEAYDVATSQNEKMPLSKFEDSSLTQMNLS